MVTAASIADNPRQQDAMKFTASRWRPRNRGSLSSLCHRTSKFHLLTLCKRLRTYTHQRGGGCIVLYNITHDPNRPRRYATDKRSLQLCNPDLSRPQLELLIVMCQYRSITAEILAIGIQIMYSYYHTFKAKDLSITCSKSQSVQIYLLHLKYLQNRTKVNDGITV